MAEEKFKKPVNDSEKKKLLAEGYIEVQDELIKLNKEWEKADSK